MIEDELWTNNWKILYLNKRYLEIIPINYQTKNEKLNSITRLIIIIIIIKFTVIIKVNYILLILLFGILFYKYNEENQSNIINNIEHFDTSNPKPIIKKVNNNICPPKKNKFEEKYLTKDLSNIKDEEPYFFDDTNNPSV